MLGLFKQLAAFLQLDPIWIDNSVFRLHYKATVIVYVTASLIVTSGQYIGDPIDCIVDGVPSGLMDTYCWIHSTFSIPSRWNGTKGRDFPHPGISPHAALDDGQEVKYHKYYQWVCFVLFFQAALFYIPRYLWQTWEGGKIQMLVQKLQEPMLGPEEKSDQIGTIVKYFKLRRGTHSFYCLKFFLCEILNLANVVGQIYFTDFFLGYEFSTYGTEVIAYSERESEDRIDPMKTVFPKVTKCTFHKYGPSGTIEYKDGLCVLPLNIINEKIYIFLWFWLISISTITALFLIYRIAVIAGPQIRVALITVKGGKSTKRSDVEAILEPESLNFIEKLGDWLVLHFICKNLNALCVNDLIRELHNEEEEKRNNYNSDTLKETSKLKPESSAV